MQINIPTSINQAQLLTAGRHVLSFVMGGVAIGSIMHVISADQANALTGAFNQIATGLSSVAAGVATLVTMATAAYAAYLRSDHNLIASVAAMPSVTTVVVATPAQADSIPSSKVVSQAQEGQK
jgi:hypothetical protein